MRFVSRTAELAEPSIWLGAIAAIVLFAGTAMPATAGSRGMKGIESVEAQQTKITVKGKVVDAKNQPSEGIAVIEHGTQNGMITDAEGNYSIVCSSANASLDFSSIGYVTITEPLNGRSVVNVTLQEDVQSLSEVVVLGFGATQKKESLTGAISSINDSDISRSLASTTSGTLVGKVAGINSRQSDGRPGASTSVQIRNMGTPLYVIDGVIKDEGQFNNLDVNDIEQISILKDASAAIYGVRAANGVVVVTTKHGHLNTKPVVEVQGYYGWQNVSRLAKPADIETYLSHYIASLTVQGTDYTYS